MFTQQQVNEEKTIATPMTLPVPPHVGICGVYSTSQANKILARESGKTVAIYDLVSLKRIPTSINSNGFCRVMHLPDGRLIYTYSGATNAIYNPKTDKVEKIDGVLEKSSDKDVNAEGVLGVISIHDVCKIHFYRLDNLNQPFETLEVKDTVSSITAIKDKFVLGGWGTIVVLGKNKEGKYEVVESLASTPNRQLVRTVGPDKNILMTVEDSQYKTNKNVLCLWKIGANNKFEKMAEKTIYFGWVRDFWIFDNGNKFALRNENKITAYDLQLNSFECSSRPSTVFENAGQLLMLNDSEVSKVPFVSVREELGASTPLFVPLLKIVMEYYGEYQLEKEETEPTQSTSIQQHGMFAQGARNTTRLEVDSSNPCNPNRG